MSDLYFVHSINEKNNYLAHHGIKGQKWGVRRFQNADGSLTAEGRERYNVNSRGEKKEGAEMLIVPAMWAAEFGLMFSVTAGHEIGIQSRAKKYAKEREKAETDPKTGLKLKADKEMSQKEDIKRVNPYYSTLGKNADGSSHNCMLTSLTYDLRRKGYDVTAGLTDAGYTDSFINKIYPKAKLERISSRDELERSSKDTLMNNVKAKAASQGEGARGCITVSWKLGGGHAMSYEYNNGKLEIIDAQTGRVYKKDKDIQYLFSTVSPDSVIMARLDNQKFDKKEIKKVVG